MEPWTSILGSVCPVELCQWGFFFMDIFVDFFCCGVCSSFSDTQCNECGIAFCYNCARHCFTCKAYCCCNCLDRSTCKSCSKFSCNPASLRWIDGLEQLYNNGYVRPKDLHDVFLHYDLCLRWSTEASDIRKNAMMKSWKRMLDVLDVDEFLDLGSPWHGCNGSPDFFAQFTPGLDHFRERGKETVFVEILREIVSSSYFLAILFQFSKEDCGYVISTLENTLRKIWKAWKM